MPSLSLVGRRVTLGLLLLAVAPCGAFAEEGADPLPLSKVVLFNSGVGFFQHDAEITGDQKVELKFNVDDINDLLKSMVLQDLGGGRISTVTYNSKDPITKTLRTFSIDLTSNPTLFDLLSQVRGEQVEVETPNKVIGTILGLERRSVTNDKGITTQVEYINLLTSDGIRSFPLSSLSRIKLLNDKLDGELRAALVVLAMGNSTDKKSVTLQFLGQGKRSVRVGYIQESPIWKTSYRLVLKDDEPAFLQGWAIVENTTEQDWKDVKLTLFSGRPISFAMNLYDPLYVPRPVVEPELFASLRPQTYGQDLDRANREFEQRGAAVDALAKSSNARKAMAAAPPAPARAMEAQQAAGNRLREEAAKRDAQGGGGFFGANGLPAGVASVADAGEVGELFQYTIDAPVTLPRQQSALLPIVNGSVKGEKVSIYNPAVHAKHPLNGLKLVNSTELHLMQGPITVFDGGAYAGDARIEDLPPGTERLISYAMDLDTEVALETKGAPEQLVSVKIVKGLLHTTRKLERTQTYTVKNSGPRDKKVLIEQALDSNWKLLAPAKFDEKTRDRYRFAVAAHPGKPEKLAVTEEQTVYQQVSLNNLNDSLIQFYISAKEVSDGVKQAMAKIIERKLLLAQTTRTIAELDNQVKIIDQEQARIRQNMQQLDRNSDLYTRYVKKFGEQEDQVERLRQEVKTAKEKLAAEQKSLDDYLLNLNVQ